MRSLTRKVGSVMWWRLAEPACGCLLLMVCVAAVRAEPVPAGGVRFPAGGILEHRDPRLTQPRPGLSHPDVADDQSKPPAASEAQGPLTPPEETTPSPSANAVTSTAPAGGMQEPVQSGQNKLVIHRRWGSGFGAGRSAKEENGQRLAAGASYRPLWDALPLAVVLALIAGIGLVVKKYMPAKRMLMGAGVLDIVARLPVSGKQSLVLVKMGRRLVLVGVSPEGISSLAVVEDPDQVAAIVGQAARGRPDSISQAFEKALGDEAGAYAEAAGGQDPAAQACGCVRNLLDKVRRFTQKQQVA